MVFTKRPSPHLPRLATLAEPDTTSRKSHVARFVQSVVGHAFLWATRLLELHTLSKWLRNSAEHCDFIDHQNGEWVIASSFSCDQLIPLVTRSDAIASRRDSVLFALVVQLQSLLDPHEADDPVALATLAEFIRNNWDEVLRIDREMGFGHDFDTLVVPHITRT